MNIYVVNAFWMIAEKIIKVAFTFFSLGLVAKAVTLEEFGVINLSISIVTSLWVVSSLGIDSVLLKEFSLNKHNEDELLSTAFIIRIISSLILIVGSFLIIYFWHFESIKDELKKIFYIIVSSLLFYNYNTYYIFNQANSRAVLNTKISLLSLILSSLIKWIIYINNMGVFFFSLSFLFDVLINFSFVCYFCKGKQLKIYNFRKEIFYDLFKQGWPMFLASVLLITYSRLDQFMIAYMLGVSESGVYSLAMRISEAYSFIPLIIATSYYPLIAKEPSDKNIINYFGIVFFVAFVSGAGVALISPYLIPYMFGSNYIDSISVINVAVFSTLFSVFGAACTNYMVLMNLGVYRLLRISIGLILNIILNLFLIPKYGMIGAVWSAFISQLFISWIGNIFTRNTYHCFILQAKAIFDMGISSTINIIRNKI